MKSVAEELTRLEASLGDTQALKATRVRLEEIARMLSLQDERWDGDELRAIGVQTEALAEIVFELNRVVLARIHSLEREIGDGGNA